MNHILGLGNSGFYSIGGLFPNHLDSVFHFIVDYLLEVVASMRPGFHFMGAAGAVGLVGSLFYRENPPPLVLGFRFSPYRIRHPGLVRIPIGIIYIYYMCVYMFLSR